MTYTISLKFDIVLNAEDSAEALDKANAYINAITYGNPQSKTLVERFDIEDIDVDVIDSESA